MADSRTGSRGCARACPLITASTFRARSRSKIPNLGIPIAATRKSRGDATDDMIGGRRSTPSQSAADGRKEAHVHEIILPTTRFRRRWRRRGDGVEFRQMLGTCCVSIDWPEARVELNGVLEYFLSAIYLVGDVPCRSLGAGYPGGVLHRMPSHERTRRLQSPPVVRSMSASLTPVITCGNCHPKMWS